MSQVATYSTAERLAIRRALEEAILRYRGHIEALGAVIQRGGVVLMTVNEAASLRDGFEGRLAAAEIALTKFNTEAPNELKAA